jgi:hypothetical protein
MTTIECTKVLWIQEELKYLREMQNETFSMERCTHISDLTAELKSLVSYK